MFNLPRFYGAGRFFHDGFLLRWGDCLEPKPPGRTDYLGLSSSRTTAMIMEQNYSNLAQITSMIADSLPGASALYPTGETFLETKMEWR